MALCIKCRSIKFVKINDSTDQTILDALDAAAITPDNDLGVYIHSSSWNDLELSLEHQDCYFCHAISFYIKFSALSIRAASLGEDNAKPRLPKDGGVSPVILVDTWSPRSRSIILACDERKTSFHSTDIPDSLKRFTSADIDLSDTTTGSTKTMNLARMWLEICRTCHPECAQYCGQQVSALPSRVLDLEAHGTNGDPTLFISNGTVAPYIALSHCWGTSPIPTTTTINMADRQKRIPFQALSKNFQDAVVATRALGVRYLWIDSLCIIQDSKEDWDIESARIELVYRNAVCTLSAAKSADGNGGLFMPRDYRVNRPFWLPISPGVGGVQIESSEKGTFWQPTSIRPTGPLYSRAWVFQEQVLSGRAVSFCSNRVFWDCLARTESEVNLGSINGAPGAGPFIKFKRLVAQFDRESSQGGGITPTLVEAAYAAWYDMLNHYSWRSITYDTDRLTALSSVARMMGRIVNDQYAAGIWRHDLTRSLLWTCDGRDGNRSKPPLNYVAPSWSWASVRGGLTGMDVRALYWQGSEAPSLRTPLVLRLWGTRQPRMHDSTEYGMKDSIEVEEDVMQILDIKVELDGKNSFGGVVAGSIRLKGWVKSARVAVRSPIYSLLDPDSGDRIGAFDFDEALGVDFEGRQVFCLLAAWDEEYFDFGTCLILIPTELGTNEYRRIGLGGAEEKYWDEVEAMSEIIIV